MKVSSLVFDLVVHSEVDLETTDGDYNGLSGGPGP